MRNWQTEVLSTGGRQEGVWKERVDALPASDVFYMPEYLMAYERCPPCEATISFGGEAHLFVYGDEDDFVVHPFFKRNLQDLPFYAFVPKNIGSPCDLTSPYGYAGPVSHVSHSDLQEILWKSFLDEFHTYCAANNIVSEFVRLNPFLRNQEPLSSISKGVTESGTVVCVDLTVGEGDLWRNLQKANRNSIARARRQGIEVSRTRRNADLEEFHEIYNATMERRKAKREYYFPMEFYALLFDALGENANLFVAKHEDKIVSASLFIGHGGLIHYFLSGTRSGTSCPGSNNLLLYEALLWAKKEGYATFNLGGGYKEGDSLFQFKSAFSKTFATFYTYRKVHDEDKYHVLCAARESYDRSIRKTAIESDYFPGYRK